MKSLILRISLFILLLIWSSGFSAALFFNKGDVLFSGLILTHFYSPVCHQLSDRCITTEAGSFLVCARCAGIYIGSLMISIVSIFIRKIKAVYIIPAFLVMFADVFLVTAGVYSYSKTAAFGTGLLVGLALFPYILSVLEKSLSPNENK
jgi:uncharacterized membrane protein